MKQSKSLSSLALVAALGLTLSACGGKEMGAAPTAPAVESIAPTPAASAPATEGPKKSPRGNFIKAVGDAGWMVNPAGKKTAIFTINSITIDPPCTGPYPQPAEKGHFVILDASIETTPDLAESSYQKFDLSPHGWQFVGANGTTYNGSLTSGASYGCLADSEILPINGIGPAEKVTGKIVLDMPATTGTLVFKPMGGAAGGWEWAF